MSDRFDLTDRVALVTGAGGGLGSHFAQALAAAGARVALSGRTQATLAATARKVEAAGGQALVVPMDVSDTTSIDAGFERIEDRLGVVDIAVCNAGVARPAAAQDLSEDDWQTTIDVNLSGCWRIAQATARRLISAGQGGSIINISSILGHRVAGGLAAYAASKGALEQLTRTLALEWAREHIRVNAIAPGYIETEMNRDFFDTEPGQKMIRRIPQKRLGQPEELVGALLLLASEAGRYMTGSTIVVDGGHLQSSL